MKTSDPVLTDTCPNCGAVITGNYCSNCGQKNQPTKVPVRQFLSDAVETLFNVDSRWWRTIKELFVSPGKVTKEYILGKRAKYLPPVRVYISVSIVYFLVVGLTQSNQIFFINFNFDGETNNKIGDMIQYALFFLVPVFGLFVQLFHRKRKAYYVEYLIFALHIHSIWFILMVVEIFTTWLADSSSQSWVQIVALIISTPAQIAIFAYFIIYLKKTFDQGWIKSIFKGFGIMMMYLVVLALVTWGYILIF